MVLLQGDCSEVCHADSPSNNPVFGLRQEYRTGPEGVSVSHLLRIVGFVYVRKITHSALWV